MTVTIPDWMEASEKNDRNESLTALEQFIYDNEPAGPSEERFRTQLAAVIEEALAAPRPVGWVWEEASGGIVTQSFASQQPSLQESVPAGRWVALYNHPPIDRAYSAVIVSLYTHSL